MKEAQKLAAHILTWLLIGIVVATGMRAAEWLIPEPATRVIFCLASDQTPVCKTVSDWMSQGAKAAK